MVQENVKKIPLRWSISATGKSLPDPKSDHWFNPECVSNMYQSDV